MESNMKNKNYYLSDVLSVGPVESMHTLEGIE